MIALLSSILDIFRILFGTDAPIGQSMYEGYFRTLETGDDLIDTRRTWGPTFGLKLPDEVLQKIYNGNAKKVFSSLPNALPGKLLRGHALRKS